jgi:sec-independent protein translocase protein TatA
LRGPGTCRTLDGMGLGFTELLIILAIVLIIFGPGKLPGLGSGMGNALRNFRKAVNRPDAIDVTPPEERKADGRSDKSS